MYLHTTYLDATALGLEKKIFKVCPFFPLGALPLGPPEGHKPNINIFRSLHPKDDPHQVWLKSANWFRGRRWKWFFIPLGPTPKLSTPPGAQGGYPSSCHEQSIFFIYQGIYIQHILTLLLLGLEKKILKEWAIPHQSGHIT